MQNIDDYRLDDGSKLTEQEKWVLEQIEEDELADLVVEFGIDFRFRHLRATFLEKLLTTWFEELKISRKGILIENAIVIGSLDLEDAEITYNVSLDGCIFMDQVNFIDSFFGKHLFLNRTIFVNDADFNGFEVKLNLFMAYAIFHGEADFSRMNIGGELIVYRGQFFSKEHGVNFSRIKVRQDASFGQTIFNSHVTFENSQFEKQFNVGDAQFLNQKDEANFSSIIVKTDISINKAKFYGSVDFVNSEITGDFYANGSEFLNRKKVADFSSVKINRDVYFYKAIFHGGVSFVNSEITGDFYANGSEFLNKKRLINFNNIKIHRDANFDKTKFHGGVNFIAAEIGKSFYADDAEFFKDADFESLIVGWIGFFRDTIFHKTVSFSDTSFMDLIIIGMEFCPIISNLDLERCKVTRELRFGNLAISKLEASYLNVSGPANLSNLVIKNIVDLRESNFKSLNIIRVKLLAKKSRVLLEGMKYDSVSAGEQWADWEKLLRLIEGGKYNTQAYTQLEDYFQRCGHKERADEVFISMKWNERKTLKDFFFKKAWNWILYIFVGYGRKPGRALLWSIFIIYLGTCIFWDSSSMVPKTRSDEAVFTISNKNDELIRQSEKHYDPILYSLDLFLPIDLGIAKYWEPKSECNLKRYYAKFQIIMGWVLITLLLASLTGIIK